MKAYVDSEAVMPIEGMWPTTWLLRFIGQHQHTAPHYGELGMLCLALDDMGHADADRDLVQQHTLLRAGFMAVSFTAKNCLKG